MFVLHPIAYSAGVYKLFACCMPILHLFHGREEAISGEECSTVDIRPEHHFCCFGCFCCAGHYHCVCRRLHNGEEAEERLEQERWGLWNTVFIFMFYPEHTNQILTFIYQFLD